MKIVVVGPGFPLRGGIANFNEALCRSLMNEGHECEVVSFRLQYPSVLFPGKTQFDDGPAPEDLKITPLINSISPITWGRTAKYILAQQPDLVVFRFWIPFMGRCLGSIAKKIRKAGVRVVAITDNVIPHEPRMGDKSLTRYFLKQCDAFVVMSRSVEDDLKSFGINKPVRFLPHPIYDIFGHKVDKGEARQRLGLNEKGKYILFFGLVRKYKGLDILLHAMSDPRLADVKLLIAGEFYDNKEEYLGIIKNSGIADRVVLRDDYVPSESVKDYFCACDLVAQTYKTATQSGITQVAYNFERPMLVTNVGGLSEIVEHEKVGYVVNPDPKSVADGIANFYEMNREEGFSTNVAIAKDRFSWKAFNEGLLSLSSE